MVLNKSIIFCDTNFWDQSLSWDTDSPRLTQCFTNTILPVVPLIGLVVLLPYDLYVVRSFGGKLPPIPYQRKNILILLTIICLSIIQTIYISKTLWNYFSNEINLLIISELFSPLIKLFTYLLVTIIVLFFRKRGYRHPICLPFQWLFALFISIIEIYQIFQINDHKIDVFTDVLKSLEVLFATQLLIISCLTQKVINFESLNSESHQICPMIEFNVFSRIFTIWLRKLLREGYKIDSDLTQYLQDMCPSLKSNQSYNLFDSMDKKYNENRLSTKSLFPLLWRTVSSHYILALVLVILELIADFIQPYFLSKLIDFVSDPREYEWHGLYYAIVFAILNIFARLLDCHSYMILTIVEIRVRTALTSAVYKKMLKLSSDSRREYTTGDINNIMGVDIKEISIFCRRSYNLLAIPLSITVGVYILWQYLGPSSLTILVVMSIVGPITTFVSKRIDRHQTKQMELKDKRIEQLSEIFNNIKQLKLYGWEQPFMMRVTQTRAQELNKQLIVNYYWSGIVVLWIVIPMFTAGISFTVFTLVSGLPLTAKTAFVSLSVFTLLGQPIARIPAFLTAFVRAFVSFKRIRKYLSSEELEEYEKNDIKCDDISVISLKKCSYSWSAIEQPILKDINLSVGKGSLIAIVGKVGSGKSSLFSALLGDMYRNSCEEYHLSGSVAYVPQTAWIQNMTLRDNITFVSNYDFEKYNKVVNACALKPDFDLLPARDMTEIGEKGINLSGGQKHRVSLARAVYQDSDIYLLDDPLSAVDAHVAQQLFHEVIGPNGLLAQKTRLLATHNISFLEEVDHIIVMSGGRIVASGNYMDLSSKGILSKQILDDSHISSTDSQNIKKETKELIIRQLSKQSNSIEKTNETEEFDAGIESLANISRQISRQLSEPNDSAKVNYLTFKQHLKNEAERDHLIEEEKQNYGNIGFRVYLDYFRRFRLFFTLVPFLFGIIFNVCEVGGNYYLNIWSSKNSTEIENQSNEKTFLSIYLSAVFLNAIFVALSEVLFRYGGIRAAAKLHKDMLYSVIRSPMSFYDTTPLGRIINRFNRDITNIDEDIPENGWECMTYLIQCSIILSIIVYSAPIIIIQIIVVIILFLILYRFYLWTSRQLRRLDSVSRSPIYSFFNESIAGAVSIRAYRIQEIFLERLQNLMDININISKHVFWTFIWIEIWVAIIGTIITFPIALFVVYKRDEMSPGLAGFMLFYSIQVVFSISNGLRRYAELENSMVSVERVKEYSELESEANWESNIELRPTKSWPTNGRIGFINYSTTYRNGLEPVLKNINFVIESGEKVGIVGRTGAGKTSITLALFRIIEPLFGRIVIDGVDITRIGLHELRSKITIIPQEPNLFAGTLRLNLDPFNQYSDKQLWSALESAHLKEFFSSTSDGLSYEITEFGDNLSGGQKQLVCLSRALLRDTKVLVLDEATAACDLETDRLIQSTIKEKFNEWTVITIAHRLNTVLDYNKIIVLDNGRIVEMESPHNLLKNTNSMFYSLAKEFGIV